MNTPIDLMLLVSIAGGGIFIGLLTVLAILIILKSRGSQRRDGSLADTEAAPGAAACLETGRRRVALAVLITGILLLSLGLPATLLALSANDTPPEAAVTTPPAATTAPTANVTPTTAPEPPPTVPPTAEPEPEAPPEPAAPDNFLISNLQLTPNTDSGLNWYRASVNVANNGSTAGSILLTAKVGDRSLSPQIITLGGGDNVTLELKSMAREIGFLATMYEKGLITQRRHEVVVQNLRETLVFEYPSRLENSTSGKINEPDWEILSRDISDVEVVSDADDIYTYRMRWQVTVRSNTEPHRVITITLTLLDASGDIIREYAIEDNELLRWDTQTYRGLVKLTTEEKERLAGYRFSLLCTSGCGEAPE
jgi:hypothetical protein